MADINEIIFFVPKVTIVVTVSDSDTDNDTDSDNDGSNSDSSDVDSVVSNTPRINDSRDTPYNAPCAPRQSFFSFRNAPDKGSWRRAG